MLDVSEPERKPLFAAVYGGHLEIVECLLHSGIDHKIKYTGKTMENTGAREFALERGQRDIATIREKWEKENA